MKGGFTVSCQRLTEKLKNKIKKEYIDGKGSYRKLAEKYNVSETAIEAIASPRNEAWRALKKEKARKLAEKVLDESVEQQSNMAIMIDKGMNMISEITTVKMANGELTEQDTRVLNGAAEIYMKCAKYGGHKSKAELEEQQARIEKLRADTKLINSKINQTSDSGEKLTLNIVFPDN